MAHLLVVVLVVHKSRRTRQASLRRGNTNTNTNTATCACTRLLCLLLVLQLSLTQQEVDPLVRQAVTTVLARSCRPRASDDPACALQQSVGHASHAAQQAAAAAAQQAQFALLLLCHVLHAHMHLKLVEI